MTRHAIWAPTGYYFVLSGAEIVRGRETLCSHGECIRLLEYRRGLAMERSVSKNSHVVSGHKA